MEFIIENVFGVSEFKDEMFNKTEYYQKIYGFERNEKDKLHSSRNNEADAFKHAFMQAVWVIRRGQQSAWAGGQYHEVFDGKKYNQPASEYNMDQWNDIYNKEKILCA